MTKLSLALFAVAAPSLMVPRAVLSQGANVDVTVMPYYTAGQTAPARDGFKVCIGTTTDRDQYGVQLTPWNGVANGSFKNLAVGARVVVTVQKTGYVGLERTITLNPDWNNHLQVAPVAGSGGPVCSTTTSGTSTTSTGVSVSTVASIPLPPSPLTATPGTNPTYSVATPKFGEQILPLRGRGNGLLIKQPDCAVKGKGAMMGGLTGYSALAVDMITVRCATLFSVNELFPAGNAGSIGKQNTATFFNRECDVSGDTGEAVVGISGTVKNGDIRSLAIHCQHLGTTGLASGPIRKLPPVGTVEGTAFGPDMCTNGRVARAIWATQANITLNLPGSNLGIITPYNAEVVTGVKLICDDSRRL